LKGEGDVVRDEFYALKVSLDIKVLKILKVVLKLLDGVRSTLVWGNFRLVNYIFGEDLGHEPVSFNVYNDFIDDID
jgi:hypothetical protein